MIYMYMMRTLNIFLESLNLLRVNYIIYYLLLTVLDNSWLYFTLIVVALFILNLFEEQVNRGGERLIVFTAIEIRVSDPVNVCV